MSTYRESEVRDNYRKLTKTLIERGLTISTMESATGGQIASLITDTEGSSAVLKGAFVTYCNEAKIMQGVPAATIERYTVYSEETAAAMAMACAAAYQADIGIGVTGTMGNVDPANPEASEPGEVYFAVALSKAVPVNEVAVNDEASVKGVSNRPPVSEWSKEDYEEMASLTDESVSGERQVVTCHISLPPQPTRLAYKMAVAAHIYETLARILRK
ncbi:MAG: CinA family protein [Lachnospiraceae bacterium]|nr:CinA family protein [Lachnospiraceae bacterium]